MTGFDKPTLWMPVGGAVNPITVTYTPRTSGAAVGAMTLLQANKKPYQPPPQPLSDAFSFTLISEDSTGTHFRVQFIGDPDAWYWHFWLSRQLSINVAFGGANQEALVPFSAVDPASYYGNPALYPLSEDGSFQFVPCGVDPADIEFFSPLYKDKLVRSKEGALELPKGARIPTDITRKPFALDVHDRKEKLTVSVPVQLHVGTDLIVMFDQTRSMGQLNPRTQRTKWSAAHDAASLISAFYCGGLTDLKTPGGFQVLPNNRIAFGRAFAHRGEERNPVPELQPASAGKPELPAGVGPRGGASLGDALLAAQGRFERSRRRRRHIVLFTDSTDVGSRTPLVEINPAVLPAAAGDAELGSTLHHVVYGLPGEAQSADLHQLSSVYGGQYHDSSSDHDPLDPSELHTMFLNALADVLPIERFEAGRTDRVPIEDGVRRAIFVTYGRAALQARRLPANGKGANELERCEPEHITTSNGATVGAFAFATVDHPVPGIWALSDRPEGAPVFVVLEASVRMRAGAEQRGLGMPITVWAELEQGLTPLCGADVRANVSRPDESIGELLTGFAQSGELIRTSRCGHLELGLLEPGAGLVTSARAVREVTPIDVRKGKGARPDPDTHDLGPRDEQRAVQRELLDAVERARNLPLQSRRQVLHLKEVRPGRYEAQLPATDVQHEGAYTFRLRADGTTQDGYAFARDQRVSTVIAPVPDAEHTLGWVARDPDPTGNPKGTQSWTATFLPRTRLGKAVGPGLGRNLSVQYAEPCREGDTRASLRTEDNLDGTYSARFETREMANPPALELRYRLAGGGAPLATIPIRAPSEHGKRVRVVLNEVQVPDAADPCLKDDEQFLFDVVVAVNGNPNRARREHVKKTWTVGQAGRREIELSEQVFDGFVEQGAALDIALGEVGFDWMQLFTSRPYALRYRQVYRLVEHEDRTRAVALFEEPDQPGRTLWKVWLTVHVE